MPAVKCPLLDARSDAGCQVKTLTPPGPTSRPTMISTIPHSIWPRKIATMPAMTRTTARIQSNVTMTGLHSLGAGAAPSWTVEINAGVRDRKRRPPRRGFSGAGLAAPEVRAPGGTPGTEAPDASGGEGRIAVAQQLDAAFLLLGLADRLGRLRQRGDAPQETAVGLVRPRHGAEALPAVAAQRVQPSVVAGAGVGIGLDRGGQAPLGPVQRLLGQRRPRRAHRRVVRGDLGGRVSGGEFGFGLRMGGEQGGRRLTEQVARRTHPQPACDWPADSRSSHASTTRSAMPVSAAFRYVRGS